MCDVDVFALLGTADERGGATDAMSLLGAGVAGSSGSSGSSGSLGVTGMRPAACQPAVSKAHDFGGGGGTTQKPVVVSNVSASWSDDTCKMCDADRMIGAIAVRSLSLPLSLCKKPSTNNVIIMLPIICRKNNESLYRQFDA